MSAVSIIQPDHTLEERIYVLQKRGLSAGARQILEEAVQLLADGRHIEAAALVDKAEAMSPPALPGPPAHSGSPAGSVEGAAANVPQALAAKLVTDISSGLAKVLVNAIQDLERHLTGETRKLTSALNERLDKIQATVECLQPISQRLEGLVQAGQAAEAKYEELAAAAAILQEAGSRHEAEIGVLRSQIQDLSASTTDRVNGICRRLEEQERQISSANSITSELAARIAATAERLEHHAGAIRGLHREHQHRAAALDQVAETLDRMRTSAQASQAIAEL